MTSAVADYLKQHTNELSLEGVKFELDEEEFQNTEKVRAALQRVNHNNLLIIITLLIDKIVILSFSSF